MGQVIHCEGRAKWSANSFFQITDVETGAVRTVNTNFVAGIVRKGHGDLQLTASEAHRPRRAPIRASHDRPQAQQEVELGVLGRAW